MAPPFIIYFLMFFSTSFHAMLTGPGKGMNGSQALSAVGSWTEVGSVLTVGPILQMREAEAQRSKLVFLA